MAPSYTQPLWLYRTLIPPDVKGLMSWDLSAWSSWGIEVRYSRGKAKSVSISEPVDGSTRCKSFRHGQRLVFPPVFDGLQDNKHYRGHRSRCEGWWRYNQRRKAALIGLSVLSSLGATVAGILDSTGLHYKPLRFYNRLGFPQLAKVQSMRKPCQQMA
jgi:hypothetical protein